MTEQEPKLFANQEALAGVRAQGPGQMPVLVKRPELMVAVRCETPSPLGCAILPLKAAPKKGGGRILLGLDPLLSQRCGLWVGASTFRHSADGCGSCWSAYIS